MPSSEAQACIQIPCPEPKEYEVHGEWVNPHEYIATLAPPAGEEPAPATFWEVYAGLGQRRIDDVADEAVYRALHKVQDPHAKNSVHSRFPRGECPFCPFGGAIVNALGPAVSELRKLL